MEVKSVSPNEWGPPAWKFIHYISLVYPNNPTELDKKHYTDFFSSLQYVLPCPKCSENYKKHLKIHPLENSLENSDSLFKWTVDIHNEVNKINNKPLYTYDEAYNEYLNKQNNIRNNFIICGILLLILLLFVYFKFHV
tara:strand:- start:213 stop:626 length:414 start_codon:yes stop_codon:yes gene_type:complete